MRIILDQNISHRLSRHITSYFQDVQHVKELGLTDEDDYKIFMEARRIGADAIFTLDSDFQMLWQLFGTPPKIIWLRVGNCSTQHLANIIIKHHNRIQEFLSSSEHDCLTILE